MLSFVRNIKLLSHAYWQHICDPVSLHPHQDLVLPLFCILYILILIHGECYRTVALICISLMGGDVKSIFMRLFAIHMLLVGR